MQIEVRTFTKKSDIIITHYMEGESPKEADVMFIAGDVVIKATRAAKPELAYGWLTNEQEKDE